MNLKEELEAFGKQMSENAPKEVLETMGAEIGKLAESGITNTALKKGDKAPNFELEDSEGNQVKLSDFTKNGNVVISFARGNWCPFCNIQYRHLQQSVQAIKEAGANLLVISPQLPSKSAELKNTNHFSYPILFDKGNKVAKKFGIAFTLAESLRPIHEAFEMDIPAHNGDNSFELPMPSTFVINSQNEIVFASVHPNWMERTDLSEYTHALN